VPPLVSQLQDVQEDKCLEWILRETENNEETIDYEQFFRIISRLDQEIKEGINPLEDNNEEQVIWHFTNIRQWTKKHFMIWTDSSVAE